MKRLQAASLDGGSDKQSAWLTVIWYFSCLVMQENQLIRTTLCSHIMDMHMVRTSLLMTGMAALMPLIALNHESILTWHMHRRPHWATFSRLE